MRRFSFLSFLLATSCMIPAARDDEVVNRRYIAPGDDEEGAESKVLTTLKDGVVCKHTYKEDQLDGETTYTFPFSQQIERRLIYVQGGLKQDTLFYSDGNQREDNEYITEENMTISKHWYENDVMQSHEKWTGSLLLWGEYFDTKKKLVSKIEQGRGTKTILDKYGQLISSEDFKEGHLVSRTSYHPNGSPKEFTPFKDGLADGLRRTFEQGGEPKTIETWVDGKQHGLTTIFHDGQKSEEVFYGNGMRQGKSLVFGDGMQVTQELNWKDDKMHGPAFSYFGDKIITDWYYKGGKVTKGFYDAIVMEPLPDK